MVSNVLSWEIPSGYNDFDGEFLQKKIFTEFISNILHQNRSDRKVKKWCLNELIDIVNVFKAFNPFPLLNSLNPVVHELQCILE